MARPPRPRTCPLPTMHHHAEIRWRRGADEPFTDRRYQRAHAWHFDGGAAVAAAASPHAVPLPFTRAEHVDPEEALVAAAASCHMLSFLFLAARAGYVVDRYVDHAVGEQGVDADGHSAVVRIVLRPAVVFGGTREPDGPSVDALHAQAHEACIVARSLRARVTCEGTWSHEAVTDDAGAEARA